MIGWQTDKKWADKFMPEIKRVVGEYLICEAPIEDDAMRNTDLIVLKLDAVRVACRIRRNEYLDKYGGEFTIRSDRPNGNQTELSKIIQGWGNYIFYGISDAKQEHLSAWTLGDLGVFRLWFMRQLATAKGIAPGIEQSNHDKSSSFRAFQIDKLPPEFVIARKQA
jgi:hypothetical protein